MGSIKEAVMRIALILGFNLIICQTILAWSPGDSQPHIVFVLADDLGYNDVSWHNGDIITPHLETLADSGIKLNQFYAQPTCSPSRAALLTGLYPIHNGFNEGVLTWSTKSGLETRFPTIAEKLRDAGYATHMLGKWHLGSCDSSYLPHNRGFDSFRGIWHSGTDHYNYITETGPAAYDLHFNDNIDTDNDGTYSSVLYGDAAETIINDHDPSNPLFLYVALQNIHTPLEAPTSYQRQYSSLGLTSQRRRASAMVTTIDDAVEQIRDALENNGMLDNSIIIFASDNGGLPLNGGANNLPLRGGKNTWFEGGVKVPSFIYSPLLDSTLAGSDNECMFHITDWFTTMLRLADADLSGLDVDGLDQWDTLQDPSTCARDSMLHNVIVGVRGRVTSGAYREGDYKIIIGDPGDLTGWYEIDSTFTAGEDTTLYLFDIANDPYEETNLATNSDYASILADLESKVDVFADGIYTFETSGTCLESEVLDADNNWITGCWNYV